MIIVDDASNDKRAYAKLIAAYKKRVPELRYIRNDVNRKVPFCRNLGIKAARYPLVAMVDDDDELYPDKLKLQAEVFRDHWDDTDIVYSWVLEMDDSGRGHPAHRAPGGRQRPMGEHGPRFFPSDFRPDVQAGNPLESGFVR